MEAHTFRYTIGDWSDDGHGKTEVFQIRSNHTPEEIKVAYNASVEKTGIRFVDVVASEYEDYSMPYEDLVKAGLNQAIVEQCEAYPAGTGFSVENPEHYVALMAEFCKLSLPDLQMEIVDPGPDLCQVIGSAGYGLFH